MPPNRFTLFGRLIGTPYFENFGYVRWFSCATTIFSYYSCPYWFFMYNNLNSPMIFVIRSSLYCSQLHLFLFSFIWVSKVSSAGGVSFCWRMCYVTVFFRVVFQFSITRSTCQWSCWYFSMLLSTFSDNSVVSVWTLPSPHCQLSACLLACKSNASFVFKS